MKARYYAFKEGNLVHTQTEHSLEFSSFIIGWSWITFSDLGKNMQICWRHIPYWLFGIDLSHTVFSSKLKQWIGCLGHVTNINATVAHCGASCGSKWYCCVHQHTDGHNNIYGLWRCWFVVFLPGSYLGSRSPILLTDACCLLEHLLSNTFLQNGTFVRFEQMLKTGVWTYFKGRVVNQSLRFWSWL